MNNKNNKHNRKVINVKAHRIDTNYLISSMLFLIIVLFISTTFIYNQSLKSNSHADQEEVYRDYANKLMQTSDYLTNRVYYYVVTGDEKYYDEYNSRIAEIKEKDITIDKLLEISPTKEEKEIIENSIELKQKVADIENQAFELVSKGELEEAQKLIFTSEYVGYKDEMQINYNEIKTRIASRLDDESDRFISLTKIIYGISVLVVIGTILSIILLILTLIGFKREYIIDNLTGLKNRNSYKEDITALINDDKEKFGALLFCDIDNLKFINDCYGHNSGDKYIQAIANVLREFSEYKSVIARPSGDEFIVYIHGFDSKDELVSVITEKMDIARNSYFATSLHIEEKVRFSTGVAIYPTDANVVDELIKLADYSMYKIKRTAKGEVGYYDSNSIDKTLFLARNSGYLNEFLDKELLDFALQPMVDATTFKLVGYEALMRPQSDIISTPYLLLELAKAESKLDKIERLVMKKVFEKIRNNMDVLKDYKIFINSIADQILTEEEFKIYTEKYPDILNNIVVEVTEQEAVDYEVLRVKSDMFKKEGALLAIDDFGAGHSNENSLLSIDYDIIKLDMNLIRNIDIDTRRQQIVKSIINFSNTHDYKILAEGVETEGEVRELRRLGIHYMQGYYFGRPELEIKGVSEKALKFLELENEQNQLDFE